MTHERPDPLVGRHSRGDGIHRAQGRSHRGREPRPSFAAVRACRGARTCRAGAIQPGAGPSCGGRKDERPGSSQGRGA